jgi:glutamate formiminotransferase/formiminotetrahydrofolate cyclodeaminase
MQLAHDSLEVMRAMAEIGNPNSVSDAGVGALCARTAVEGAYLNVKINASGFDDPVFLPAALAEADRLLVAAKETEAEILKTVYKKING